MTSLNLNQLNLLEKREAIFSNKVKGGNQFIFKIDGIIFIYIGFIFFLLYKIFFQNFKNTKNKLFKLFESKLFLLGLFFIFLIYIHLKSYKSTTIVEKEKVNRFRIAIHLGIVATIIALFDYLEIVIAPFFLVSFIVYFLNLPV